MAIKQAYLESRVLNKRYVHPYEREARKGDIIEFILVDSGFDVSIPNHDNFLQKEDGSAEVSDIRVRFDENLTSKKWKVNSSATAPSREYTVKDISSKVYADSPGSSPPKIVVVP
jgi:hypothetical protein